MSRRIAWLAVLLFACGQEHDPPATLEPEERTAAPTSDPPSEQPRADEAPPPTEQPEAERLLVLPESGEMPAPTLLRSGRLDRFLATWPVLHHPDPIATRRLGALLAESVRHLSGGSVPEGEGSAYERAMDGVDCSAPLATEHVVSILCESRDLPERGDGPAVEATAMHFAIRNGEVRPFVLAEAFSRELDLGALVQARCDAAFRRAARGEPESEPPSCNLERAAHALGADGIVTLQAIGGGYGYPPSVQTTLPYSELRDAIRPDGPLVWAFAGREPPPLPVPEAPNALGVSAVAPLTELAARWGRLERELRADVVLAPRGEGTGQLVVAGMERREHAARVAAALGETPTPASIDGAHLSLALMRTRSDLALRASSRSTTHARMILPRGARLVAIRGEHDRSPRRPRRRDPAARERWAQAVVGEDLFGFVSERWLAEDGECAPSPATFLAGFDEAARVDAGARLVIARLDHRRRGARSDAVLFAASGGGSTRVALHELGADCVLGEAIIEGRARGLLRDLRAGGTARNGGDTFVVVGTEGRTPGLLMVDVLHAGSREPVWTHELSAPPRESPEELVRVGITEEGAYWPLVVEQLDPPYYAWDGRRLVAAPEP